MPETAGRPFLLRSATIHAGVLQVELGATETWGTIEFTFVRGFVFFKESDLWKRLASYEHQRLIDGGDRTLGVFMVTSRPILGEVFDDALAAEEPNYFWLSTPDECLEVVAFDSPTLKLK